MSTLNTGGLPTMMDIVKVLDPNGMRARVVEALAKTTPIIEDAVVKEGNLQTGHQFSLRTALPSGTWRKFNQGITPSKGLVDQLTETCASLESLAKIDCGQAELNGGAAYRADQEVAQAMGLGIDMETAVFYASSDSDPEKPHGLAPRLHATTDTNATNLILHTAGASGNDQTSMWLVCWGMDTVYLFTPKGIPSGLQREDLGKLLTSDGAGGEFPTWNTHYKWRVGVAVEDWRGLVRIGNIDTGSLSITNFDLVTKAVTAFHRVPQFIRAKTRMRWYCNRTVAEYLHQQALTKIAGAGPLYVKEIASEPVTMLLGIPVRTAECIVNTESTIA